MRYSSPSFRIDKADWLKGNNSYDDFPEGGALYSTVGINSFSKPGLLTQAPVLGSSVTESLPTSGVISWGIGSGASAPAVLGVQSNASFNGYFYSINPTTGAMTQVGATDTARLYKKGITDTVFYNGNFYTSSTLNICKFDAALTTMDQNWWTGTSGKTALVDGVPHPLLVYESIMYIADGRYLHKLDGSTISLEVWDAPPDHVITAMVEYNGLIYITAEPYKNLTGSVHGLTQMFSWDGLLESWYEQYFLDYRVNALYVYKNKMYMWTNEYLALWTGSEAEPIFPISNQVFKCHITATSNSMVFADGPTLIRYGKPFSPSLVRKFYRYMSSAALDFGGIISLSENNMIATELHATASKNYYISNFDAPATSGTRKLTFNMRPLKTPIKMKAIVIETSALASGQKVKAGYINDVGTEVYPTFKNGEFDYADAVDDMHGKTRYRFDFNQVDATRQITPVLNLTGGVYIKSVDYIYEASEFKTNK